MSAGFLSLYFKISFRSSLYPWHRGAHFLHMMIIVRAVGTGGHTMGQACPKCKETPSHMLAILIFLVLMYPYVSLGVPLVPKSHDTLVKPFKNKEGQKNFQVHGFRFLFLSFCVPGNFCCPFYFVTTLELFRFTRCIFLHF